MGDRQPLIILTCMRSYSSLVSTMLGQHPGLYALPEVNPVIEKTIGEMLDVVLAVRPRSLDGLLRAVAELEFGGQDDDRVLKAQDWIAARRDWTPVQLMSHLSDAVAPSKLIDKSPSTVLVQNGMKLARRFFPDAYYLHLYRHPVATSASISKITEASRARRGPRKRNRDPEDSWYDTNARILKFGAGLPPARFMSVQGEDVLRDPECFLPQICEWLGLDCPPDALEAMKHPERAPYAAIGPTSAPFGNDPNFLRNPVYAPRPIPDPDLESPLDWASPDRRLKPATCLLSYQLGYGAGTPVPQRLGESTE